MAFCDKCGAYIPDGQSACLACGYDSARQGFSGGSAAASAHAPEPETSAKQGEYNHEDNYSPPRGTDFTDELKKTLEAQRQKQKENAKKWAQDAYVHMQSRAKPTDEGAQGSARSTGSAARPDVTKLFSIISYIDFLWLLPFIFAPDNPTAKFHAKQGMVLTIAKLVLQVLASFLHFGWVVSLVFWGFRIKGIINAADGREEPLPYIGELAKKF